MEEYGGDQAHYDEPRVCTGNVEITGCHSLESFRLDNLVDNAKMTFQVAINGSPNLDICMINNVGLRTLDKLQVTPSKLYVHNNNITELKGMCLSEKLTELIIDNNPILTLEHLPVATLERFSASNCDLIDLGPLNQYSETLLNVDLTNGWICDEKDIKAYVKEALMAGIDVKW